MLATADVWGQRRYAPATNAPNRTVASIAQGVYGGCAPVITHTTPPQPEVKPMAIRQALAAKLLSLANAIEQDTSKEKLQAKILVGRRKLADWIQPDTTAKSA
jgi:hypothetical protein